ncbi:hypothetical protein [Streptomyces sp. NPDC058092]|uniref:hypothetical protein n=1 Tax=Streptomyces sp. NPDC058092 TaxID=3346336 RepID=UPI0036E2CEF3
MSTHAVNQFETHAQRAAGDLGWEIKPFSEITSCPLAAMTRTLLHTVLDKPPFGTGLPNVADSLPTPASAPELAPSATGSALPAAELPASTSISRDGSYPLGSSSG